MGFFGFLLGMLLTENFTTMSTQSIALALTSGLLGLVIGDYFLFKAFSNLGASRTLVIYSFQPVLLGIYGFFFLSQTINIYQLLSILFMMSCVFTFALERNRKHGKWDLHFFLWAFLGVLLDAVGVMLTRTAFELTPTLGSFQMNLVRAFGALMGVLIFFPKIYLQVTQDFSKMTLTSGLKIVATFALGTFLSLTLYLQALKTAHVATLTAISITGPIWAATFEHVAHRQLPNRYLIIALFLFFAGFALMAKGMGY